MLTAEIKINGERIALIVAKNVATISDRPGDFIGERATVCEYRCVISEPGTLADLMVTVNHDRRFGWQGLLNKITKEITPDIIETVSV